MLLVVVVAGLALFFYKRNENARLAVASNSATASQFLTENRDREGVITTATGLQYQVLQKGRGERSPSASDTVKVHYHGTLRDGTVFDSSVQRGTPAEFPLNRVIPCWTEGVAMMKPGGKAKLICPSEIAYGDRGQPPVIPGGAALVFDVELIEVVGQ